MHLLQPRAIHMRIDLRRRDVGVAKHGLHRTQVGAAFEEMRGEGMGQRVQRDPFVDAGDKSVAADKFSEPLAAERFARAINKNKWARRV